MFFMNAFLGRAICKLLPILFRPDSTAPNGWSVCPLNVLYIEFFFVFHQNLMNFGEIVVHI